MEAVEALAMMSGQVEEKLLIRNFLNFWRN
jgi:hypothetical protein